MYCLICSIKKKIPIVKATYYLLYQFKVETEARKDGKGADTSHGEIGDPWKKMSRPVICEVLTIRR